MIDSVGAKPDLRELGTRFDHYMELKEVFLLGIDVIDRMNSSYVSDADKVTKLKLAYAVEMINKRLDYLSDFSNQTAFHSKLARDVRDAGIHRPLALTEGSNAEPEKPQSQNTDQQGGTESTCA